MTKKVANTDLLKKQKTNRGWFYVCHCQLMLIRGGCQDCYLFEQEPLLQNLRFVLAPAGEIIYSPRSLRFDPSWYTPTITDHFLEEYAEDSTVLEPFVTILWNLGWRAATAIKKELHGMLQDRGLVQLLRHAARDMKAAERRAMEYGDAAGDEQAQTERIAAMNAALDRTLREWEASFTSRPHAGNGFSFGTGNSSGVVPTSLPAVPYCPACGTECAIHHPVVRSRPRRLRRWFRDCTW